MPDQPINHKTDPLGFLLHRYRQHHEGHDQSCYLVFDTETTGLPHDPDARVVELGVAMVTDPTPGWYERGEFQTFQSLVRPNVITEAGLAIAKKISGITAYQLEHAPSPSQVWGSLEAWLEDNTTETTYPKAFAWNAPFDVEMMVRTFYGGADVKTILGHETGGADHPLPSIPCVMRAFTELYKQHGMKRKDGSVRWFKLTHAADLVQLKWAGHAHRADADALMTLRLLVGMALDTLETRPARAFDPASGCMEYVS